MFGVNRARSLLFYIPAAFFQLGEDTALTTEVYPIVKDRLVRVAAAYTGKLVALYQHEARAESHMLNRT